jgi:GDPmannose 4,6-dehydratase|tara:strand:+ start:226 stop:1290 length:1065 start_codon:yes stop_codon:yes gene_type:complete
MARRTAVVTGATGQDGSYLSELLLDKGYSVHGMVRRTSQAAIGRNLISHLIGNPNFHIISGDLADQVSIENVIKEVEPDEFYNLGAQSFVPESWRSPTNTSDITGLGALRCLEAIKTHRPECKFYQAGSSEQFGKVVETPQDENTPFYPRSPYGCAKVFAHYITKNYRESYDLHASTGILFNHESPRRGIEFVTRKVTLSAARISSGIQKFMEVGNVEAKRDWGYAGDYVEMMWKMTQRETPDDYVISTGETYSVKDMINLAFGRVGMELSWTGEGIETIASDQDGNVRVKTNPKFFRPAEVDILVGNSEKASRELGWTPKTGFEELIFMMVDNDMEIVRTAIKHEVNPPSPLY